MSDEEPNLEAGIQSVTFKIVGPYAYGYLQSEIGVHRLVRMSPFGSGDTRQTSFAAVDVLPELPDDIEIEHQGQRPRMAARSAPAAPAGSTRTRRNPGVRLIHKPTGVRAESRTEQSQHKNNDNASKLSRRGYYAIEEQKRTGRRREAVRREGRNRVRPQIRSYVMQPYTLVREERDGIDVKTPAVKEVLDGDFDQFMHAFLRHKTAQANRRRK